MNILGRSEVTAEQMALYLIKKNPNSKSWALKYARICLAEGEMEGVRGDGAWIQSCKETGNFTYSGGTAVTFDQNNFCGLGVTSKGVKGHSFDTPNLGFRAQIQHLKGYATSAPLNNPCIDPRYKYINPKGKAPRFEDLAGKWAVPGYNTNLASSLQDAMNKKIGYGFDIIKGIEEMKKIVVTDEFKEEESGDMSYALKVNYADKSNYGSSRTSDKILYIVWHYTANDGDTDEANGNYFKGKNRGASAHYFVDDDSVTISVPDNYVAWSVGGSRYSNYLQTGGASLYKVCTNTNSINIELCDTVKDGKYNVSEKTLANAIELTRSLMDKYNIPIERVVRHFDVTGKSCPAYYVDKAKWGAVKDRISGTKQENSPIVSTSAETYTVQSKDTLSKIGAKVGIAWTTIAKINNIKAPYNIKVGQVLKLKEDSGLPFVVKVKVNSLNVRAGAGMLNKITHTITNKGKYTIVDVKGNWGKLKSGIGWINISNSYVDRV